MKKIFLYVLGFLAISGIGYGIYRYATGASAPKLLRPKLPYETDFETEPVTRNGQKKTLLSKSDFDKKALNQRDQILLDTGWKKGIDDRVKAGNFWEGLATKFRVAEKDPLTGKTVYSVNPDAYLSEARAFLSEGATTNRPYFYYDPTDPTNYA